MGVIVTAVRLLGCIRLAARSLVMIVGKARDAPFMSPRVVANRTSVVSLGVAVSNAARPSTSTRTAASPLVAVSEAARGCPAARMMKSLWVAVSAVNRPNTRTRFAASPGDPVSVAARWGETSRMTVSPGNAVSAAVLAAVKGMSA